MNLLRRLGNADAGLWSFVDQAATSAGNFLLMVILARKLAPGEYGVFVLLYGVMLALNAVHLSIITYPLSVLGVRGSATRLTRLTSNSLLLTATLDFLCAPILLVAGFAIHQLPLALFCIAVLLVWQWHETLRRALMSRLKHRAAVFGDAVMYLGQASLVLVLALAGQLTVWSALAVVFGSAVVGAIIHSLFVGWHPPVVRSLSEQAGTFLSLGRWPLVSNGAYSAVAVALPWLLARHSFDSAATYQALVNLVAFANPIAYSVGNFVVPVVAAEYLKGPGQDRGKSHTLRYAGVACLLLAPYFALVLLSPRTVIGFFYSGSSPYSHFIGPLRVLAIGFFVSVFAHVLTSYFLGRKNTELVLITQVTATGVALLCAVVGIPHFGVMAAAVAFTVMNAVRLLWLSYKLATSAETVEVTVQPASTEVGVRT